MRVRTSADSIRNLERLLAFDEAAGSRSMWSGEEGFTPQNPRRMRISPRTRAKVSPRPGPRSRMHTMISRFSPNNLYSQNRPLEGPAC